MVRLVESYFLHVALFLLQLVVVRSETFYEDAVLLQLSRTSDKHSLVVGSSGTAMQAPRPPWLDELIEEIRGNATTTGEQGGAHQSQIDALKKLNFNTIGSDLYNIATGSGDAMNSIIAITKAVSSFIPPPYGPAIGMVTDILGGIFSLFGGKSQKPAPPPPPTIQEITAAVQDVVDKALAEEDFQKERNDLQTSHDLLQQRIQLIAAQIRENRSEDFLQTFADASNNFCQPNLDSWQAVLLATSNDVRARLKDGVLASKPFQSNAADTCKDEDDWNDDCWKTVTDSRLEADRFQVLADGYVTSAIAAVIYATQVQDGIKKFNALAPSGWDGEEAQAKFRDMLTVCGFCSDCGFQGANAKAKANKTSRDGADPPTIMGTIGYLHNATQAMQNISICPNFGSSFAGPKGTSCDTTYLETTTNTGGCCNSVIVPCPFYCDMCFSMQIDCPLAGCDVRGGMTPTPGAGNVWGPTIEGCGTAEARCGGVGWPCGCDWFGGGLCQAEFSGACEEVKTQLGSMTQSCSRCKFAAPASCIAALSLS